MIHFFIIFSLIFSCININGNGIALFKKFMTREGSGSPAPSTPNRPLEVPII